MLFYVIDCFNSSIDSTIFALLYLSLSWKMTCYCCMLAKFKHARVIFLKVSFYNNCGNYCMLIGQELSSQILSTIKMIQHVT